MNALSAARVIGGNCPHRHEDDFYPTPPEVTEALVQAWPGMGQDVWEPACGDGAMSSILEKSGRNVIATDLVDRGLGGGVDFLLQSELRSETIVTNPPFKLAVEFIQQADRLGARQLALYLKATYWHASSRYSVFNAWQPSIVMPLTWRPDFTGKGAATLDAIWCVWDRAHQGETVYRPITRPVEKGLFSV